jgi:uncharacterized repeat protein (TIGR01451 family)
MRAQSLRVYLPAAAMVAAGAAHCLGATAAVRADQGTAAVATCGTLLPPVPPDSWQTDCPMPTPRRLLAAAEVGGKVYALGGCGSACFEPPLQTSTFEATRVEVYDPAANSWSARQPMPVIFFDGAAAAPGNGKIYTLGGALSGNVVQEYDPGTDSWSLRRPMPTSRRGFAAVALGGKIYAIGGSGPSSAVEVYDPAADTWTVRAPLPTARVDLAAATVGGKVYALGGSPDCCGNSRTATVEVYDPATDTWAAAAPLPVALQLSAAVGVNGRIYAFGGFVPGAGAQGRTFEYSPDRDSWTERTPMLTPRDQAPAVLLPLTGAVFVLGGAIQCHCQALAVNQQYVLPAPVADLAIHLEPRAGAVSACQPVRFTVVATNLGPATATGALVRDIFPPALAGITWTCTASPGARCAAASAGHTDRIEERVDLPAGGSVTYEVSAILDAAAAGILSDTATIEPPAGLLDPRPDNNQDTVTLPIAGCTLLAVTKQPDGAIAQPAGTFGFTVVVANLALSDLVVHVTDDLVAGGLAVTSWCRGARCSLLPADRIDDLTRIANRGSVTYRVSGTVPCGAARIENTACAAGPDNVSRCASSSVPVAASCADLAVQNFAPQAAVAGTPAPYRMLITNHGPCAAHGAVLSVTLPAGFGLGPLPGSCVAGGAGDATVSCRLGRLELEARSVVELTADVPCGQAAGPLTSIARVSSASCDLVPANNVAERATGIVVQADYEITKQAFLTPESGGPFDVVPGSSLSFVLLATNHGPSCPAGIPIADVFPSKGLSSLLWCRGAGCTPATPGDLADTLALGPQKTETFIAGGPILPGFRGTICNTATVSPPPGVDPNPANNSATACVSVPPLVQVPSLSPAALALLALCLSSLAVMRLRRGGRRDG